MTNHLKTSLTRQEILGLNEAIESGLVSEKDQELNSHFGIASDMVDEIGNIYLSAINLAISKSQSEPSKPVIEVLPREKSVFFKGIERDDTSVQSLLKRLYKARFSRKEQQWYMSRKRFDSGLEQLANELDALGFDLLVPDDYASVVDPTQLEQPPEVVSEEITVTYEADNYTTLDELDASFVRAGIKSKPRDGTLLIDVTGKADDIFQTAYFYRTKIKRVSEQPSDVVSEETIEVVQPLQRGDLLSKQDRMEKLGRNAFLIPPNADTAQYLRNKLKEHFGDSRFGIKQHKKGSIKGTYGITSKSFPIQLSDHIEALRLIRSLGFQDYLMPMMRDGGTIESTIKRLEKNLERNPNETSFGIDTNIFPLEYRGEPIYVPVVIEEEEEIQPRTPRRTPQVEALEGMSPLGRSQPVAQEFLEKLRDSLEPYGLKIDRLESFDKLVADYEFGIFSYELPYNTSYEKVSGEGLAPTASIYGKDTDWSLTFKGLARAVHFEGITQANFNRAISEILNYFKIQPEQEVSYIAIPNRPLLSQQAKKLGVLNRPIIKPLTDDEILEAGLDRLGDDGKMVDQGFPFKPSQLYFYKIPKTTEDEFISQESADVGELLAVGSTTASGQEEIINYAISVFDELVPATQKRLSDGYFRLLKKDKERALNQLEQRMKQYFQSLFVYFPFPLRLVLKSMAERVFVEPSEPIPEREKPVQVEEPSLDYAYLDEANKKIKNVAPLVNEFLNVIYAYNQTSEKELLETFAQLKAAKYAGARLYSSSPSQYMQLGGIMLNIPIIFEGGTNADAKLTLTAEKHVLKGTRKTTVFVPELSIRYGNESVIIDDPFQDFYKKEGRNLKATITTPDKQKTYQRFLKKYGLSSFESLLHSFIFQHLIMGEEINGMSGTASMGFSSGSSTYVRAYLELGSAKLDFETILKKLESPKYIETEGRSSYTAENIIPSGLKARSNPNHTFIKSAFKDFKKKGTEGSFTRYVAQNFTGKNTPSKRKKAAQQIKKEYEKWERGGRFGAAPYTLKTYRRAIFYLNILEK